MFDSKFKKIVLCSVVTALCGAAQVASAHTGIKDSGFIEGQGNTGVSVNVTSGVVAPSASAYDAFTVSHGCASNTIPEGTPGTVHRNVIAMEALFPTSATAADNIVYRYKTGSILANTKGVDGTVLTGQAATSPVIATDLSDDISGVAVGTNGLTNLGLTVVSPNLFGNVVRPKLNAAGATVGYYTYNTAFTQPLTESIISTTGLAPFKIAVPTFKSTSCAVNLIIRAAVSNWCTRAATGDDRKDVWIGTDTGSVTYSMKGPNAAIMPNSVTTLGGTGATLSTEQGNGASYWPKMTVHRNLTTNPLPAACNGDGYDVVVEPSGAFIDANLTIPGFN